MLKCVCTNSESAMGKFYGQIIAPACWQCLVDTKSVKSVISCLTYSSHSYFVVSTISWPLTTSDKQIQSHGLMGLSSSSEWDFTLVIGSNHHLLAMCPYF